MSKQSSIPPQLLPWLSTLPAEHVFLGSQQIYEFQNGLLISQVLKLLVQDYRHKWVGGNSPAIRTSNWNAIIEGLKILGIQVTQDQKTQIVGGSRQVAIEVVYKLRDLSMKLKKENEVDVSKIDPNKALNQADSVLQLLILAIGRNFNLSPKQSVTLLSNDGKYLAHILAKGLRGEFPPVQNLFHDISKDCSRLIFLSKDNQSKEFVLKVLKPGTISKNEAVAHQCIDFISTYLCQFDRAVSIDIFKAQYVGTCLLGLRRHPSLLEKTVALLLAQTDYGPDTLELIKKNMEESGPNTWERVEVYQQIYRQAGVEDRIEAVESMKGFDVVVKVAVDDAIKNLKPATPNMNLLLRMIEAGSPILGEAPILRIVDKCIKNNTLKKVIERTNSIVLVFQILTVLAQTKNKLAPQIYKSILNSMPEYINTEETSDLFFRNLKVLIKSFQKIPLQPLLEGLAVYYHQLQEGQAIDPTPAEIELISQILSREDLDSKLALIGLNLITKLQMNSVINAQRFGNMINDLIKRFSHQDIFRQIANKFAKISLAIFYANQKKKQPPKRKNGVTNNRSSKESPAQILLKLKNTVILKCLDGLLALKDENINQTAFPLIAFTVIQLKAMGGTHYQGLMKLLGHYGSTPEDVLREFQAKNNEAEQQRRQKEIQAKQKQQEQKRKQTQSDAAAAPVAMTPIKPHRYGTQSQSEKELTGSKIHQSQIVGVIHGSKSYVRNTAISSKVTEKVMLGLEKYHKSYMKKVQKAENQEKAKADEEQRRINLKKALEIRMMQQGLTFRSDHQVQLLFEFGAKEKAMKLQKPAKYREISYFDVQLEEDRDIRALQYTLKRYHKAIRFMYVKYSNSMVEGRVAKDFDQFAQKVQSIKGADVWKLIRDHGLDEYVSGFENQEIIKLVNQRNGNKSDINAMDFSAFQKFLVQLSVFMFSRPPKDLRCNPVSMQVQQTMRIMRENCERLNVSPQLFDDPDTAYFNEGEVIKQLNRKLADNPGHILPEGYKKIVQKKVDFEYSICLEQITPAYKDCFEILDELLASEFNVHMIEPFTKVTTKAKARPALFQFPKHNDEFESTQNVSTDRLKSRSEHFIKLSQSMKAEVAKYPIMERPTATKVAAVLEDILVAVELGHDRIGMKLENQAVRERKVKDDEYRRMRQEGELKRKQRQESIKKQMEEAKEKKLEKERQAQQQKRKEQERKKEEEEKRKQKDKELKEKLAEYQTKKKQQEEKAKHEQEQRKKQEQEQQAKKKKELQEQKRKLEEARKKKEEEQQARKEKQEQEHKAKKAYEEKLFKEKQKALKQKIQEHKKQKGEQEPGSPNKGLTNSKVLDKKQPAS